MTRRTAKIIIQAASLGSIFAALAAASPALLAPRAAQPERAPAPAPAPAPAADKPAQPDKPAGEKPADPAPAAQPEKPPASTQPATTPPSTPAAGTPSHAPSTPAASSTSGAKVPPGPPPPRDKRNRIVQPDDTYVLAFKNVSVEQVLPFIVETTGKVVLPRPDLLARKITIFNDQPIKRSRALDLVFFALQQEGIAVIETNELVILINIADLVKGDVPVLGPDESTLDRDDYGTVVEKIFALKHGSAQNLVQSLEDAKTLPDYAKVTLDATTNQVVVMGNIGLLQRIERIVNSLDRPSTEALSTDTFRLKYADAEKVATNIRELFSSEATNRQGQQGGQPNFGFRFPGQQDNNQGRRRGQQDQNQPSILSENLRVTANTQQNSVTVLAEQRVLDQIADAIEHEWDRPLDPEQAIPKTYKLKFIDPIKARDLLEELFGKGAPTSSGNAGGGGGGGGGFNRQFGGGNQGGSTSSSNTAQGVGRLAGQFSFAALPDSSTLVVVAKSPDNMEAIDKIIDDLDQPQTAGLPTIIELKHASAEELAEQLNTLLAQEGTLASIQRAESGLDTSASNTSPFSTSTDTTNTNTNGANGNTTNSTSVINFWWQRARPPTDFAGTSNLVSKVRIVPVWRQNALMIMAPAEYRQSLSELIEQLDRPGRQVLIAGIVFEISLDDATALGLRWSSSAIVPNNPDNSIGVGNTVTGTKNNLIDSLFDTSVLNTNVNLNVLLQALNQKTNVNILSEPRIFTSDNQEAEFFDGQDIPFVNELQTNNNGNPTQSFDYRAVGIALRVRPRITVKKDVDLRINLELSSVSPGQSIGDAFIVDRRETTTHLIVNDGQTVVISGIMRREESKITRKIPLLGDIPLIGSIFTSIDNEVSNTELIAFVTPIVIENTSEADDIYKHDRDRLLEMRKVMEDKGGGATPEDASDLPPPSGTPRTPRNTPTQGPTDSPRDFPTDLPPVGSRQNPNSGT